MSDESIHVPTGLTTEGLLGKRYLARLIDSVLVIVLWLAVLALASAVLSSARIGGIGVVALSLSIIFVVWIAYGAILESSPWQATVGKKCMGLRVYNAEGGRPAIFQAA